MSSVDVGAVQIPLAGGGTEEGTDREVASRRVTGSPSRPHLLLHANEVIIRQLLLRGYYYSGILKILYHVLIYFFGF